MLIFSISFPDLVEFHYFMDIPERRVWGERRPQIQGDFLNNKLVFTLTLDLHAVYTATDTYMHNPGIIHQSTYLLPIFLPTYLYMKPISYRIGYQGETKY